MEALGGLQAVPGSLCTGRSRRLRSQLLGGLTRRCLQRGGHQENSTFTSTLYSAYTQTEGGSPTSSLTALCGDSGEQSQPAVMLPLPSGQAGQGQEWSEGGNLGVTDMYSFPWTVRLF